MAPSASVPVARRTFKLNTGAPIPAIGFGTFADDGPKGGSYKAVMKALEVGYRHLDCAWYYMNEEEVGEALRDFLASRPDVKRSDIFICSKVWNHLHAPEDVRWSAQDSLRRLGIDYFDLFLVHWPIASEKTDNHEIRWSSSGTHIINQALTDNPEPTWRAMEALVDDGLTRAIGVSNWSVEGLKKLLTYARIPPAVNQVEIHPFLPNNELVDFCLAHGILPEAYSPLGSQGQVKMEGEKVETVRENATLNQVAERSGYSLAQILIAWGVRRGYVVLPKSATPSRIESNFQVPDLSDEDFEAIQAVAKGRHTRFVNYKGEFGYDLWPDESVSAKAA